MRKMCTASWSCAGIADSREVIVFNIKYLTTNNNKLWFSEGSTFAQLPLLPPPSASSTNKALFTKFSTLFKIYWIKCPIRRRVHSASAFLKMSIKMSQLSKSIPKISLKLKKDLPMSSMLSLNISKTALKE